MIFDRMAASFPEKRGVLGRAPKKERMTVFDRGRYVAKEMREPQEKAPAMPAYFLLNASIYTVKPATAARMISSAGKKA